MDDSPQVPPLPAQVGDKNIAPTTTAAQDLVTHGQRKINLIWEVTQSLIALAVTMSVLYVSARLVLEGESKDAAFLLLSNAFFLVVSVYIQRTNHQKIGGVKDGDAGR